MFLNGPRVGRQGATTSASLTALSTERYRSLVGLAQALAAKQAALKKLTPETPWSARVVLLMEESAHRLNGLPCADILFARGNHEDHVWWQFAEA